MSVCVCVVVSEFVLRPYSIRHEVGEKEQSNNSNGGQTSARERLSENEKSWADGRGKKTYIQTIFFFSSVFLFVASHEASLAVAKPPLPH